MGTISLSGVRLCVHLKCFWVVELKLLKRKERSIECNLFVSFLRQGANGSSKTHNLSAASKLKHLQQNNTDKTKNGKREDFQTTGGQQQVAALIFSTVTQMLA